MNPDNPLPISGSSSSLFAWIVPMGRGALFAFSSGAELHVIFMNLLEKETKKPGTKIKGGATPWVLVFISILLISVFLTSGSTNEDGLRPMARDERVGVEAIFDTLSRNEKLGPLMSNLKKRLEKSTWWVGKWEKELVHVQDDQIIFSEAFFDMDTFGQQTALLPLVGQPLSSLSHADDELAALEE